MFFFFQFVIYLYVSFLYEINLYNIKSALQWPGTRWYWISKILINLIFLHIFPRQSAVFTLPSLRFNLQGSNLQWIFCNWYHIIFSNYQILYQSNNYLARVILVFNSYCEESHLKCVKIKEKKVFLYFLSNQIRIR